MNTTQKSTAASLPPDRHNEPGEEVTGREFGRYLRSRRERLSPATVGLSTARMRRTPGLRREEVAELAGIGVDWYVRLGEC